jgi:hypothetical protein
MKDVLVSSKPTGRQFGDKKAAKQTDATHYEVDMWEGPCEAGETGEYFRTRWRGKLPDKYK